MDLTLIFEILQSPWMALSLPVIGYFCWQHVRDYNDLADCLDALGANKACIFIPNQLNINEDLTIPANITLRFIQGGSLNIGEFSIRNDTYRWGKSAGGTNEFYLELAAGGDPGLTDPLRVNENDVEMTVGAIAALAVGEWAYGTHGPDALGFNTIYVRLSNSATDNTGDTTNGNPTIAGMADTSDFNVGDHVTISAGFPAGVHEIIGKTANSITLDINANATIANVTVSTYDPDTRAIDYLEAGYVVTIN